MSLSLLQGYSSAEGEEGEESQSSSSDDDAPRREPPSFNPNAAGSLLPSAFDAFSQAPLNFSAIPPKTRAPSMSVIPLHFGAVGICLLKGVEPSHPLRSLVVKCQGFTKRAWLVQISHTSCEGNRIADSLGFHFVLNPPPSTRHLVLVDRGAVVEAKAQLVGIHERVRSDIEGNAPTSSTDATSKGLSATLPEGVKRIVTATNPDAKDASELLMMCLQCGVPKTYTNARGMVCPECGDRPPSDEALKKKGSTVKDKEKVKRMRGQSSHASWKSETEMHLRQQFD
ncbi:hypothetical protein V2J09_017637 [Rumex salicifolius]